MQKKELHGPPAYFTINWQESFKSVLALSTLNPSAAGTGHGLPMFGEKLQMSLQRLLGVFEEKEMPASGTYTKNPIPANQKGIKEGSERKGFPVGKVLGVVAFAGVGYFVGKKLLSKASYL
ncbi:MAG: hypothetical protein ACK40G_16055 [Cytophagaceae bacterium]